MFLNEYLFLCKAVLFVKLLILFQINMKGLDGIQGPMYVGTGCVFRRQALYGYEPPAQNVIAYLDGVVDLALIKQSPKRQNSLKRRSHLLQDQILVYPCLTWRILRRDWKVKVLVRLLCFNIMVTQKILAASFVLIPT